jgi:hypothetical protein
MTASVPFLFRTVAKGKLGKAFEGSVKAVEARSNGRAAPDSRADSMPTAS